MSTLFPVKNQVGNALAAHRGPRRRAVRLLLVRQAEGANPLALRHVHLAACGQSAICVARPSLIIHRFILI